LVNKTNNMTQNATNHSIHLITARQGSDDQPAYTYIMFRNHEGKDAMCFLGMPMKRGDDTFSIRAVMDQPMQSQLNLGAIEVLDEVELFRGSGEEYLRKMVCAADAAKYINDRNVNFDPENFEGDGPNSVARTLVKAMDLEFPVELEQYWIPGYQHTLVPKEWRSVYAG